MTVRGILTVAMMGAWYQAHPSISSAEPHSHLLCNEALSKYQQNENSISESEFRWESFPNSEVYSSGNVITSMLMLFSKNHLYAPVDKICLSTPIWYESGDHPPTTKIDVAKTTVVVHMADIFRSMGAVFPSSLCMAKSLKQDVAQKIRKKVIRCMQLTKLKF